METLTERISGDPDIAMQFIQGLVERDEAHPDEDYVFQLPEEVKEEYRHHRQRHKPSLENQEEKSRQESARMLPKSVPNDTPFPWFSVSPRCFVSDRLGA